MTAPLLLGLLPVQGATLLALAASDCEQVVDGLLAQPRNSLSSLAFVAGGGWLALRGRRRGTSGWRLVLLGTALVAAGLGSVVHHGGLAPTSSGWLHDVGLVAVPVAFVGVDAADHRRAGPRLARRVVVALVVVLGAVLAELPDASVPVAAVAVAAAVVGELVRARDGDRPARPTTAVALVALVGALPLQLLGRTGGPLCDPQDALQPHALWHVLAAVALTAFGLAAFDRTSNADPPPHDRHVEGDRWQRRGPPAPPG